ncbi:MAG: phosphoribosylanthranilate isomerase [Planctomycetes bacterium]|nr:phosphoribosylanthranilate isomerase [Planctomycetota bacterium]
MKSWYISTTMPIRVKICGITNPDDAERAATLGADMVGLNFYAKSPRSIDVRTARSILSVLPSTVEAVALFVNEPPERARDFAASLGIQTVQIHGEHRDVLPVGVRWIPAFSVRHTDDLAAITSYLQVAKDSAALPYAILVDAHVPGLFGGTGTVAPWHLLADFEPIVPLFLAGGLTPDNVAEAIRIVKPGGVDVASGVESSPGKKDAERLRRFIEAVRSSGL